ncbi:hypothetical protein BD414DRAFT_223292 [Trametes punicea]|nr:hypothetical protein BD414DRAFT_223292 [Trametes punicea]
MAELLLKYGYDRQATSTPHFVFINTYTMTTCADVTILWNYTGPSQEFSLFISPASSSLPPSLSLIAFSLATTANTYTWRTVNVSSGLYEMIALGQGLWSVSPPFLISPGMTTSCLRSAIQSTTLHPNQLIAVSLRHPPVGMIVGGVIAGVTLVVAVLGACLYMLRRRSVPGFRWRTLKVIEGRGQDRTWSALSSNISIGLQQPRVRLDLAAGPGSGDHLPLELLPRRLLSRTSLSPTR